MSERRKARIEDYAWTSEEDEEMARNGILDNRLNPSTTESPLPTGQSFAFTPSASGQSSRYYDSSISDLLAESQQFRTGDATPHHTSPHDLSARTRCEPEISNRVRTRLTLQHRTPTFNRPVVQHRLPSRSTPSTSEGRHSNPNHFVKRMLILRKCALGDKNALKLWTSILRSDNTMPPRRNVIASTSDSRHSSGRNHSTSRSTIVHNERHSEPSNRNVPQTSTSSSESRGSHTTHLLQRRVPNLTSRDLYTFNPLPPVSMPGDMELEEEIIEVVADDPPPENIEPSTDNVEPPTENVTNESVSMTEAIADVIQSATEENTNSNNERQRPTVITEQNKESEVNQSLLRLLECPVCLEFMEPPMAQCRRGHLVCASCRGRIASCPICRTAFSSVRNRAMEAVSEIVRYPCRHGCGRETRLRRREAHEANCANRTYACPVTGCSVRPRYQHTELLPHYQDKHPSLMREGERQTFTLKLNQEHNEQWLLSAHNELFHVGISIIMNTWSLFLYVIYVGPKRNARNFTYEVTVVGKYNNRKMLYSRVTHSDLENNSFNVGRHDCFYISLDQALNYIRFKNKYCDPKGELNINLVLLCNDNVEPHDSSDICID